MTVGDRCGHTLAGMSDERDPDLLTPKEFEAHDGVEDWRITCDGVTATFRTPSFAGGTRFADEIARLDGLEPWLPDVDLRHDTVTVRMLRVADDWYGPTRRSVELARSISSIARELRLTPDPSVVQGVHFVVEAVDIPRAMAFWRAALGYEYRPDSPDEDLIDLRGRGPSVWFEALDVAREERNTIHVACWVPYEQAEARVAAALAAGGSIVRAFAPMWWTLADPEGNEVDIATTRGRG
jgi:4a-hydroxytetrahydrobiopterin dehydratase